MRGSDTASVTTLAHSKRTSVPSTWLHPVAQFQALSGLRDPDPQVRLASAEVLRKYGREEALTALREANAVESIVSCKEQILRAIMDLELRLAPEPLPL
jgi:hypothetical protein